MRTHDLRLVLTALMLLIGSAGVALALEPGEKLDDPRKEQRAQELSEELRCLVCQNQSINESNAPLAKDMRTVVRERIEAGASDREIKEYLTARYGDFVLLKPPMKPETYALWFGPAVVVVLGAIGVAVYFRRRQTVKPRGQRLSQAEEQRLNELLNERDGTT
jgi:cytochrome c-type biogenesis protein CcmH